MLGKKDKSFSHSVSLLIALVIHLVVLIIVKKEDFNSLLVENLKPSPKNQIRIDQIDLIKKEDIPFFKRVGIKDGSKKDYLEPDMLELPKPKPKGIPGLSLENLGALPPKPETFKPQQEKSTLKSATESLSNNNEGSHFYYNPKKEKKIPPSREQDLLKQEAFKNIASSSSNAVANRISNFEIRYERPEGVSEDELNSEEKAYYSFFKRSYANYLSKLYATYEKIAIERPGLERDLLEKHLLIGKIEYDPKGNIVVVKILKSSSSDNVHYFFEETLKQLNLPNPPKSYIKNKKQFTTYYQIQIN